MTPGTLLDEDPITTARLSVEAADPGSVTLLTEVPGVGIRSTYDVVSGRLTGIEIEQAFGSVDLGLVSRSRHAEHGTIVKVTLDGLAFLREHGR